MTPIAPPSQRPSSVSPTRGTGEPHRAEQIYEQLSAHLQNGWYAPGEKLTLRELASEFGASLTPVRDALNRMVAERVLEMTANRTVIVPIPLAAEVREVRRIRMEIEGFAAAEAALHMTASEMAEVERYHVECMQARQSRNIVDMQAANSNLHFTVYAAARMPFLLEMIKTFWLRNGPLQHLLHQSGTDSSQPSDAHHEAVVLALRQRDADAARKAIRDDIAYPTDAIIVALSERRDSLNSR